MTYFPAAFIDIASDPDGEALRTRVSVRLNDGAGGSPGTLLTVTDGQEVVQVSQIQRKRERSFGVIQGQAWQVQVTNIDLAMLAYSLPGCWACIEGGFPDADEWVVFAQGKISSYSPSMDGTVTIEVRDAIMDVLGFTLKRDIRFQESGWVSGVDTVRKAEGSQGWDEAEEILASNSSLLDDETFSIKFTNDTEFSVYLEDGTVSNTGDIANYCSVYNLAGDTAVLISPDGWTQGTGNYAADDTFEFFTARPRTAAELSPINMVRHLIEDVAGLTSYDVLNGAEYSNPIYDSDNWDTLGAAAVNHVIAGEWKKGAKLSVLIQDALKVVHGTIFPAPLGQVALWALQPVTGGALVLNGDPGNGRIDIINSFYVDSLAETVTDVLFEYLALGSGEEASYSTPPMDLADSPLLERKSVTITTGWEVRGASIEGAATQYLTRNQDAKREHTVKTTLVGAVAELGGSIAIREAATGLSLAVVSASEVGVDLLANSATVKAFNDPYVNQAFFVIGESLIGGPEVLF